MIQQMSTVTFRNKRGEYLFINEHSFDNQTINLVFTNRNGEIIQTYDLPIPMNTCAKTMAKAGWKKVNF